MERPVFFLRRGTTFAAFQSGGADALAGLPGVRLAKAVMAAMVAAFALMVACNNLVAPSPMRR